jgi:hypothetical protein
VKRVWIAGMLTLLVAAVAATPAGAAGGSSANANLCKDDGWKTLYRGDGSTFANQGDCVSYAVKGNTILTEPPNAWKAACEQAGGTFSIGNSHVGNTLNLLTPPAYAYVCDPVSETFWHSVLTPICFGFPDVEVSEWTHHDGTGTGNCIRKGTA